ncbi:SpaA isopeptide-forming pilin-related protein [Microbacterium sp. zg-Y818]|uniref:prealbumin-like fold domain-containing protein n=1 Tax=unclassified Microbacterium TaxID=2609290 RepID=UPI00214C6FAE|nr:MULTISPECIES: SpaA isopeptide-forming pilin-related protein [unclassified Microbacterium]MCR2802229.1 SpaA isopeptide-forming pilin-related protein [Microbacterium sp. zg.Y818]WIM22772.1 SpaA isopeptide-forming pilin-related protein [Microbacterium sp. zg-Y818]
MSGIRRVRNQQRAERRALWQRPGGRSARVTLTALLIATLAFANAPAGAAVAAVVPPTPPSPTESPAPEQPTPAAPTPESPAPQAPAPTSEPPAPEQPAPEPEAPAPAEPGTTDPPATESPAAPEEADPLAEEPGIVTPLAAVSDCAGGNSVCGTLNIVNVVQGGSATPADWALRANIVGTDDWYDFTSGQTRRVTKPGSYTLEAIGTPGVTDDYTTTLSCFLNDTSGGTRLQFTEAEALVQYIGTGNQSLVASCTFTHTSTAPGTLVLSKGGERTGAQTVAPLAGATFSVYSGGTETEPDTDPANLVGTCETGTDGLCEVSVPSGAQYWVVETAAPEGYQIIDSFDVGTSASATQQPYRLRTAVIPAGETVTYPQQAGGNTNLQARGSQWANAAINPTLAQTCGLRVGLLVDLSNSLQSSQQDLRDAAAGFVDTLEGTPSSIGIWTFAGGAPAVGAANTTLPLTPVSTPAGAATVRAKANSLTVVNTGGWEQGTNWDQGLWQVAGASTADTLDVLLVLTDGSPTYYSAPGTGTGGAPSGPGNRTRFVEMENAVASANALKIERGTSVVGVGIGPASAGEEQNLQAISGPTVGQDYFLVDGYEDLRAFLEERALGECAGTVNVTKLVIPAEGDISDAVPTPGWTFDATTEAEGVTVDPASAQTNETGAVSFAANGIAAGGTADVTVTETQQAGFELVQQDGANAACTDNAGTAVPVTNAGELGFTTAALQGGIVTCTVYNRAPDPTVSLRVDKAWVVDGVPYEDGTQPVGNADLTLDGQPRTFGTTYPQYTVGDTVVIGEEVSGLPSGCTNVSSGAGDHVITADDPNVVTVTNTVTCVTSLTLVKSIANGDATVEDFTLTASPIGGTGLDGPSGVSGTTASVTPGVRYLLAETGPATYVQTVEEGATLIEGATGSWDCVVDGGGDYDGADGGVTVSLGQEVTCTATNQTATIVLLKQVVNDEGGTLTADAWQLTADPGEGVSGLTPTTVTGAPSATADNTFAVRPGQSYTLSEAGGGTGYREFALEQLVAGVWTAVDPAVTVPALGTNTYRFVNVDVAPTLTLVKTVTNDDGGTAAATDWTLSATSPGEPEVTGVTGTEAVTAAPVFGGVPYTLAETGPEGYTWESLTCDNGAAVSPSSPTLTLEVGEAVTCTFVNDDVAPTLTLVKEVTNAQGGTAVATDWTLSATTPGGPDLTGVSGAAAVTGVTVPAGATYTLAESGGPTGYDWVALSCDNGAEISPESPTLTLGLAEDVTCTFSNTDLAGSLTLVKEIVNDNGGTAVPEDWNQRLTAQPAAGETLVFDHSETIGVPGGTYTLAEIDQLAGYELTGLSCTTGQTSLTSPTVTVPNGDNVTCTFVNDDIAPTLTLVKTIANDDGGTAAATDWTLSAATPGGPDLSGATGAAAVTAVTVPANSEYTLAETGPDGYDWSSLSCDNGADASVADPTLTLALDEDVTCTFVNDDVPGTLTLLKQVVNDDGGTAVPTDWNQALTAQPAGGTAIAFDHDVSQQVTAGEYTLAESGGPEGYEWTALTCSTGSTTLESPAVTVANGEEVICSFTNDDVAPTLTLVKTVTNANGGTAEPTEWTLAASTPGGPALSGVTGTPAVTAVAVPAGAEYTLAESGGPDGYEWTSLVCDNGATTSPEEPTLTLGLAEDVTCTFGNTDVPGSLTLVKDVDNTLGGSAVPADWNQRLTAQPATGAALVFDHAQTQSVPAGSYTLAEVDQIADYEWTALSCDTGGVTRDAPVVTVANGQSVTCTFTNAAIAPTLTLVKNVDNQGGVGTATPEQWTLNAVAGESDPLLSGEGTRTGTTTAAVSGQVAADVDYALSETFGPSGYTAGDWACVETDGGAAYPLVSAGVVRLSLGVDVTCEIVNTAIRAEGTIDKQVTDGSPVHNADGTWTISYDIVVTNNSDTSTFIYSLADALQYGEGITPTAATWTGPDGTSGEFTLPAGTATLATDVSLPTSGDPAARATHTYTVTVTASIADGTQDGDAWRCDTAPGVPTAGGFLNSATLSATGEDDQTVFGCGEPAFPTLVKTGVDPATQNPDASWNVSYTLTLSNPGAVAVQAALTDTLPSLPGGWELDGDVWTIAAVGEAPAPTTATAAPGETAAVFTGQLQPAASLVYAVSGVLRPTVEATDPGECATGGGIVNTAGVTSGEIVVDAEGCVTVRTAGVTVDKSDGAAQQLPDGQWQIDYVVTVTNTSDTVATVYTLTDTPDLGEGIVLVSGEWVGTAPAPDSPLAAGATAEYTFRVVASIDPAAEDPSLTCEPGEGGAFFNGVTVVFPGGTAQDDGCAEPGGPTVTKTGQAPTPLGAGVWIISYAVEVSNTSGVTVAYTLEDRPEPLSGGIALVTPWTVTGPTVVPDGAGTAALAPDWDGAQQPTAATGLLPDGATHTYTVSGQVSVVDADPDALTCGETPEEGGVWNTARVDNGAFESTDEDCSGLVVVPVELEKSDGTVSELGEGRWRIDYVVTVTNPGLQPTTYTLTDAPEFDTAFTILAQGWVGSPNVADVQIPAGGVDTYTYRVDAASTQNPLPSSALECSAQGGGFFNTATATHPGGVVADSGCAVPVTRPAPAPGPGLAGTGGTVQAGLGWLGGTALTAGILLLVLLRRRRHSE